MKVVLKICWRAAWAPVFVFFLHRQAARAFGHEPYVDPVMHFLGGLAIAFFLWRTAECLDRRLSNSRILWLTGCTAIAWEIMEYFLLYYRGWVENWDPVNTARDVVLGLIGAGIAIWLRSTLSKQLDTELSADRFDGNLP